MLNNLLTGYPNNIISPPDEVRISQLCDFDFYVFHKTNCPITNFFLQNEANFFAHRKNITRSLTIYYDNFLLNCRPKNKAKTNPIQTQTWGI
jgi:hypothetical protein